MVSFGISDLLDTFGAGADTGTAARPGDYRQETKGRRIGMTRARIAGYAIGIVLVYLAVVVGYQVRQNYVDPADQGPAIAPPITPAATEVHPPAESHQGFLYGRITTTDGATYEGRLRWGGGEEASWGDYFNGAKNENPWAAHVQPERLKERRPVEIFGIKIAERERQIDLDRPFMARFGDIARIEPQGREIRVTLKSGAVFILDRFAADDLADGVRVWDGTRGIVDFDERRIRLIELLSTPSLGAAPYRLHGTVRTRQGDFTGFVQWNREKGVGTDTLDGSTADGELSVRFDTIRSIARNSRDSARVSLGDGVEIVLSDTHSSRGIYVDDGRYGRVLVSWDAFERIDFSPGGSGPAYDEFPPGHPITGSVATRSGDRLTGRLVFDLDESETTETLDAPSEGVDYTIPFGLVASIVPPGRDDRDGQLARVTLHNGEELWLERAGDLGEGNAGMLIFVGGRQRPEYVPWTDVERIDLNRPAAMYPPLGGA
jgi:hypothetical protein